MREKIVVLWILLILLFAFFWYKKHSPISFTPSQLPTIAPSISLNPSLAQTVLGARTKTDGCLVQNALPDTECTPGAVFANATKDDICRLGYSKSVRNVPTSVKDAVYKEYSISSHQPGEYEVDHLISLELGGSNDIANLWPEAADPRPGYHEKDKVENYLHDQVCSGSISLQDAQKAISGNWVEVYQKIAQ